MELIRASSQYMPYVRTSLLAGWGVFIGVARSASISN